MNIQPPPSVDLKWATLKFRRNIQILHIRLYSKNQYWSEIKIYYLTKIYSIHFNFLPLRILSRKTKLFILIRMIVMFKGIFNSISNYILISEIFLFYFIFHTRTNTIYIYIQRHFCIKQNLCTLLRQALYQRRDKTALSLTLL